MNWTTTYTAIYTATCDECGRTIAQEWCHILGNSHGNGTRCEDCHGAITRERRKAQRKAREYQGHRNWNHWNVSLWICNEYPLYRAACDAVRTCNTRDEAARHLLSQLPKRTPDGAPYTFTSVRAALVGWE